MNQGAHHPGDAQLAALLDGSLQESVAQSTRQHLEVCGPCRQRLESFRGVIQEIETLPPADDGLVSDTLRRVQQTPHATHRAWYLVPAATVAAAAALLFLVWPSGAEDPELVARGAHATPLASVRFEAYQVDRATVRSRRLLGGERLAAAQLSLAVSINHLPDGDRFIAVYARDAGGRITWLLPTWTAAAARADCLALSAGAGAIPATSAVTPEGVATGRLEVSLLVFDVPCAIPDLDARLEHGLVPAVGGVSGLRQVDTVVVEIVSEP